MLNIIKEYRHYLATLLLVIVPVIALNAGGKKPADLHWFDRAAISISAPVQSAIKWTLETAWEEFESYLFLVNTHKNNISLSNENRKLLNELAAFEEVARENERLKKLVEFNEATEGKKIIAQVIAQDVSPEFRLIRLNKGADHGIVAGMAVVALEGIVGRVFRTGKHWSDVLTLLDGSSAIDALLQRNRVRGVIEGLGDNTLSLKYLRRTDEVLEGDIIVSSGIGGIFPKGLNIGKVQSVKKKNFGITQIVEVTPSVDFNKLEEVTVIDPPKTPVDQTISDSLRPSELKNEKAEKSGKSDKAEKNGKTDKSEKTEKSDKAEKNEKTEKSDKPNGKTEKKGKPNNT